MPLAPLSVTLTDWQKVEAIKRFRQKYATELTEVEAKLTALLLATAEAEFLMQYLGEQPELKEARSKREETETLSRRRDYLGQVIDRLDHIMPKMQDITAPLPTGAAPARPGGLKRF
jgi:hypothetical protein